MTQLGAADHEKDMSNEPRPNADTHSLDDLLAMPDEVPIRGMESNGVSAAKTLINVWRFLPAQVQEKYETDGLVCAWEHLDAADEDDDWDEE